MITIIKNYRDFDIIIRDELRGFFKSTPAYRVWVNSNNNELLEYISAEIIIKKSIEEDRIKINKVVEKFEKIISDYYRNKDSEKARIMEILGEK